MGPAVVRCDRQDYGEAFEEGDIIGQLLSGSL